MELILINLINILSQPLQLKWFFIVKNLKVSIKISVGSQLLKTEKIFDNFVVESFKLIFLLKILIYN